MTDQDDLSTHAKALVSLKINAPAACIYQGSCAEWSDTPGRSWKYLHLCTRCMKVGLCCERCQILHWRTQECTTNSRLPEVADLRKTWEAAIAVHGDQEGWDNENLYPTPEQEKKLRLAAAKENKDAKGQSRSKKKKAAGDAPEGEQRPSKKSKKSKSDEPAPAASADEIPTLENEPKDPQ